MIQRHLYCYLRANLPSFLDDNCKADFARWIADQENQKGTDMTDDNRLEVATRISWEDIYQYVLDTYCAPTLGSFHFRSFFTLKRGNGVVFPTWCNSVEKITNRLLKHKQGWETIVHAEALTCLTFWLTNSEVRLLMEHLLIKNLATEYPDIPALITKCTVASFIKLFKDIKPDRLPKNFKQSQQKKALKRTLVPYDQHQKVLKQLEDCNEEISNLKQSNASLKKGNRQAHQVAKNAFKHQQRTQSTRVVNTTKTNNKADYNDGVKVGQYGKAPEGFCQKCMNAGLGKRRHNGPCDDDRRKNAVAAKEAKAKKQRTQQYWSKNRTYKHHQYERALFL